MGSWLDLHFSPPDGRSTRYDRQDFVALACRAQRTDQVRLRAPSGSRLVLTALSPTSPRRVVRNAGSSPGCARRTPGSRYAHLLASEIGLVLRRLRIDSCLRASTLEATDLLLISCGPILPDRKPLVPDEALYTFQVADGCRIEWSAARLMNQPLRSSGACYEEHGTSWRNFFSPACV